MECIDRGRGVRAVPAGSAARCGCRFPTDTSSRQPSRGERGLGSEGVADEPGRRDAAAAAERMPRLGSHRDGRGRTSPGGGLERRSRPSPSGHQYVTVQGEKKEGETFRIPRRGCGQCGQPPSQARNRPVRPERTVDNSSTSPQPWPATVEPACDSPRTGGEPGRAHPRGRRARCRFSATLSTSGAGSPPDFPSCPQCRGPGLTRRHNPAVRRARRPRSVILSIRKLLILRKVVGIADRSSGGLR